MARDANARGGQLAQGLAAVSGAALLHPNDANMVFASFPRGMHRKTQGAGAKYYFWPFDQSLDGPEDELLSARLVCSWSTSEEDVAQFLAALAG
jgi:threonine aldolase